MATETTIRVTCDRCKTVHYEGPQKDRPQHIKVNFWSTGLNWEPEDLCEQCAALFVDVVRNFRWRDEAALRGETPQ